MGNKDNIRNRSIRVSDDDWEIWKDRAHDRRTSVNRLIIEAMGPNLGSVPYAKQFQVRAEVKPDGTVEARLPRRIQLTNAGTGEVASVADIAPQPNIAEQQEQPKVSATSVDLDSNVLKLYLDTGDVETFTVKRTEKNMLGSLTAQAREFAEEIELTNWVDVVRWIGDATRGAGI